MANSQIWYNNKIKSATITATTQATTYEKENLLDENPQNTWRSTSIAQNYLTFSFTAPTPIQGIATFGHNLITGDTFVFEAANNSSFSPVAATATITPSNGYVEVAWSYQYYRLKLQKLSETYIKIAEIYLAGTVYTFAVNLIFPVRTKITKIQKRTDFPAGFTKLKTTYCKRTLTFPFESIPDTQKDIFESIQDDYICLNLITPSTTKMLYGIYEFAEFIQEIDEYWDTSLTFTQQ